MILYTPPTIWGLLRGAAINLLLPFVNGLMLGFGELFAHEAAFRLGWGGTKVRKSGLFWFAASGLVELIEGEEGGVRGWLLELGFVCSDFCLVQLAIKFVIMLTRRLIQVFPEGRSSRPMGPGIEIRDDPVERRRREGLDRDLDDMMALE